MAQTNPLTSRTTGILLVVLSALVFSTAGLFSKGLQVASWDIIFWRALFAVPFTVVYAAARGNFAREFLSLGRIETVAAIISAIGTAAYIPAFKLTSIANVSLIYAATPMLAALLGWIWLREKPNARVLSGCVLAIIGVALIVSGSLGAINLRGDALALVMAVNMAILFVMYRRFPQIPAAGLTVLSSLLIMPLAFVLGDPKRNNGHDIAIMAAFGLFFAIASVTLQEGAKRLPAGEGALLSLLEVPFAPLFAWLVLSDIPPALTFVGGALIIIAILIPQLGTQQERP
jgi:drug/metabolite transporter (DMT)-like permease